MQVEKTLLDELREICRALYYWLIPLTWVNDNMKAHIEVWRTEDEDEGEVLFIYVHDRNKLIVELCREELWGEYPLHSTVAEVIYDAGEDKVRIGAYILESAEEKAQHILEKYLRPLYHALKLTGGAQR